MSIAKLFIVFVVSLNILLVKCSINFPISSSKKDIDVGGFVRSDSFIEAFNNHGRIVKDLEIVEYTGNYRSTGFGDFHLHDNVIKYEDHIHSFKNFMKTNSVTNELLPQSHYAYIHENDINKFPIGTIIIGHDNKLYDSIIK